MSFTITQTAGDSAGPKYSGSILIPNGTLGSQPYANNAIQIGAGGVPVSVLHNASVVPANEPSADTGAITIYGSDIIFGNVSAMVFTSQQAGTQTGTPTPTQIANAVNYIKLKGAVSGGSHDIIIVLQLGQIFTWYPPITVPTLGSGNLLMNGIALGANITSITCIPDVIVDVLISATIEMTA